MIITKKQVNKVYETLTNKELLAHQADSQAPFAVQGNDKDLVLNDHGNDVAGLSDALIIELARLANAKQILLYLATDGKSVAELAPYADVPNDQDFLTKYMIEIAGNDDLLKVWNGENDDYFVESLAQELDYCYTMAE